jgi:2-dehydro-3-deoxyphosphogluconate aldolase/(4S)-4-hydroxy-2-oxoglutarate aldolase
MRSKIIMENVVEAIKKEKIIAIMRGLAGEQTLKTAKALRDGGIRFIEVTFNQSSANCLAETGDAIRAIGESCPDICVGAGTVLTTEQAETACRAGAKYIISPDFSEEVVARTLELGMLAIPGVMTPTEAQWAYKAGAAFVKLFPVVNLGPDYIRAIRAPLSHIPFLAVGGVDDTNMEAFYRAGICGFGIGGLADKKLIAAGDYDGLRKKAECYAAVAASL